MIASCKDCSKPLSQEEIYFYEDSCEECERAWLDRYEEWRKGKPDLQLDAIFNPPHG